MKKALIAVLYWTVWVLLSVPYWIVSVFALTFMLPVRGLCRVLQRWANWYVSKID